MRGCIGNPAAGFRRLGARSHARLLDEQTETLALSMRADERVIAIARLISELHTDLRSIETHSRRSNEIASTAVYEAPASMLVAA